MLSYLWVEPVSLPYVFHCIPISAVICANLPNGIHSAYIPESYSDLGLGSVEDLPIHVGSFPMAFTTTAILFQFSLQYFFYELGLLALSST